jgi:hypothetical protein
MNKNSTQSGNVLFLILIAVVLFAALSYAVTQSTRGGGDATEDKLKLDVARVLQQGTMIKTEILRRKIFGEEIQFDDSSGGIYESGEGITLEFPPDSLTVWPSTSIQYQFYAWSYLTSSRLIVNGVDVGTSAADDYLILGLLTPEACAAINNALLDDDTVPSAPTASVPGSQNRAQPRRTDPLTWVASNFGTEFNVGLNLPSCVGGGSNNHMYVDVITEN